MLFNPLLLWKKRYSSFTPLAWLANTKPVWKRKRSTRMINDPTHLKTEVHIGHIRASNGKQCALEKRKVYILLKVSFKSPWGWSRRDPSNHQKGLPQQQYLSQIKKKKDPECWFGRQLLQLWSLSINPSLLAHQWQRWRRLRRRPWTKDLNRRCLAWE